jgi:hypothetical protein
MSEPKKCENPSCACLTDDGEDYCGPFCESSTGVTEVQCECGHDPCRNYEPAAES